MQNMKKTAEKHHSPIIDLLMKEIPLRFRLKTSLEMHDYDNWDNGTYNGDVTEQLDSLMNIIIKWKKDGAKLEK